MSKLHSIVSLLSICAIGGLGTPIKVSAQTNQLPQVCYELRELEGTFKEEYLNSFCKMFRIFPNESTSSKDNASAGIDYVEFGRSMQWIYENPSYIWPDGSRGFISDDGSIYRFTKQIADDGSIVYYSRVNRSTRIFRYDASRDATGYTDVWSYSVATGYLKCRVTMLTDYGQYLDEPQITHVETDDMYSAFRTLLNY